jgi:hypothetical protein
VNQSPAILRKRKRPTSFYAWGIRSIMPLCIVGWVSALIGYMAKIDWLAKTGLALFMAGFAVWGFTNGGGFIWAFWRSARKRGVGEWRGHPWALAFVVFLTLFFLTAGVFFVWFVVRIFRSGK